MLNDMNYSEISLYIGILGMLLILFAFLLNQLNIWKNDNIRYDVVNFIGSLFLVIYAIEGKMIPFLILNLVWTLYSAVDIVKDIRKMKK